MPEALLKQFITNAGYNRVGEVVEITVTTLSADESLSPGIVVRDTVSLPRKIFISQDLSDIDKINGIESFLQTFDKKSALEIVLTTIKIV